MKQKNNKINSEFSSIEETVDIDVSNKSLLYQQNNATHQILQAIEESKDDIKDTINSGIIEKNDQVEQYIDMSNNDCENCKETLSELSTKYQLLDNNISNTNKIITIVGTVIGLILTVFIFTVTAQYSAIKDSSDSKYESISTEIKAINQRLDYQEKLNAVQIQRDVAVEIKNQSVSTLQK